CRPEPSGNRSFLGSAEKSYGAERTGPELTGTFAPMRSVFPLDLNRSSVGCQNRNLSLKVAEHDEVQPQNRRPDSHFRVSTQISAINFDTLDPVENESSHETFKSAAFSISPIERSRCPDVRVNGAPRFGAAGPGNH
ncbi:MAG TPA: hypothetical protein VG345_07670, partial [Bryobacteraceae bacterium]|nr:hypothetical protein [Bryobacteraceae bacterium]